MSIFFLLLLIKVTECGYSFYRHWILMKKTNILWINKLRIHCVWQKISINRPLNETTLIISQYFRPVNDLNQIEKNIIYSFQIIMSFVRVNISNHKILKWRLKWAYPTCSSIYTFPILSFFPHTSICSESDFRLFCSIGFISNDGKFNRERR